MKKTIQGQNDAKEPATQDRLHARACFLARLSSAVILFSGMMVLAGWALDIQFLKSISPNYIAMKANTAICFVLTGFGLWLLTGKKSGEKINRMGLFLCSAGVLSLGLISTFEYLFAWDAGIDQLIFKEAPGAIQTTYLGRMAFNTAICFTLVGAAMLFLQGRHRRYYSASQILILIVGTISLFSVTGYLFGVTAIFFGEHFNTAMAIHTSLLFCLITLATLLSQANAGLMAHLMSENTGGVILRRLLPIAAAVPIALGWLGLRAEKLDLMADNLGELFTAVANISVISMYLYFLCVLLNRAEAKRRISEKSLRKSEARFSTVFQSSPAAIALARLSDNRFVDVNRMWQRMTGYSWEEAVGRTSGELGCWNNPGDRERLIHELQTCGTVRDFQARLRRKSGEVYDLLMSAEIIDIEGEPCLLSMAYDITAMKKAKEELLWKTAFLETMTEASLDGLLVVNADGHRVLTNQRFLDILRVPSEISKEKDDLPLLRHVTGLMKNPEQFLDKVHYLYSHREETSRDELALEDGRILDR
jgi:PAS domain S-box-containing protein